MFLLLSSNKNKILAFIQGLFNQINRNDAAAFWGSGLSPFWEKGKKQADFWEVPSREQF